MFKVIAIVIVSLSCCVIARGQSVRASDESSSSLIKFKKDAEPLLSRYCFDCHGDGAAEGNLTLDGFDSGERLVDSTLWLKVLKNLRSGIMPPTGSDKPSPEELAQLENWIKQDAFGTTSERPNPGRIIVPTERPTPDFAVPICTNKTFSKMSFQ